MECCKPFAPTDSQENWIVILGKCTRPTSSPLRNIIWLEGGLSYVRLGVVIACFEMVRVSWIHNTCDSLAGVTGMHRGSATS